LLEVNIKSLRVVCKGIGRKISRGGQRKNSKKYQKIALLSLFQERGANGKKTQK